MKSPLFKIINKTDSYEGIRLNRRVIVFLVCICISFFFWLLMSLSKEYSITISFPAQYVNLPSDKVISNLLPQNINMEIKSNGFNLLIYKLRHKREIIAIDIKDSKPFPLRNHYYLFTNSRIDKITNQFSNQIKVLRVFPDTIFLNYDKKINKKVLVKAILNLEFEKPYQLAKPVLLSPEYITISGSNEAIDKIKFVETVAVNLKKINNSTSVNLLLLKKPEMKNIEFSVNSVEAKIHVTKFTEGNIELPVEVENLPPGLSLKTYPDKINVKYNVAFENYERVNASQFRAFVDYKKIGAGSNKLKVELEKFPSEIQSVKINPEKVEYIIRKK